MSSQTKVTLAIVLGGAVFFGLAFLFFSQPQSAPPAAPQQAEKSAAADPRRFKGPAYVADFTKAERPPEFSEGAITTANKSERKYLGPFREAGTTFTLVDLPEHKFMRVTFDLALLISWNGSSRGEGPDEWMCELVGGPKLLSTTFSNTAKIGGQNQQAYPDSYPFPPGVRPHAAWTGASETETLGNIQVFGSAANPRPLDTTSVYRMDWTFPHTGSKLEMNFYSQQFKKHDKIFGFLSFKAEPIAGPSPLSDVEAQSAWETLAQPDAVAANAMVWKLIASGDQAVKLLSEPVAAVGTAWPPGPAALRITRARHVLEVINNEQSKQLLAALPVPETPVPGLPTAPPLPAPARGRGQ